MYAVTMTATSLIAFLLACTPTPQADLDPAQQWGKWRGPHDTGHAPQADPPIEWSESHNVRWKAQLPGLGHSTPLVWGGRVFVTTAVTFGDALEEPLPETAPGAHDNRLVSRRRRWSALAFERATGKPLWSTDLHEGFPHEGGHVTGSYASASPVTDGEQLFAFFGSAGLYALDLEGVVYWKADLGEQHTKHGHGEGASPALHGDTLVINWDHEGQSFVVAFDKQTGEERWREARDEVTSWSSPIIVEHEDKPQVIVAGTRRTRAYDLATGRVVWECGGLSHNVVATPVAAKGVVYAGSSYEKQAFVAIRLAGARGDVTNTDNLLWYRRRGTPYVPSPLLLQDSLYFLSHYQGPLRQVDVHSGRERHRSLRLDGFDDVYASPVAAGGRIYVVDRSGATIVLRHASPPELLARNTLLDRFSASPALVGGEIYLRGEDFLYCIAEDETDAEETRNEAGNADSKDDRAPL